MALEHNCNNDVAAAPFVIGLLVTHSFNKHLVKHEVTKMRDILSRAQKYIQIENATRNALDWSFKGEDNREKPKPQPAFPKKTQNQASSAIN